MSETLLQIPGQIDKVESRRNRSLRLVFTSQEEVPPEVRSQIMSYAEQYGYLAFFPGTALISPEDVVDLPQITLREKEKSPAERLRAILWLTWEQADKPNPAQAKTDNMAFEYWYRDKMEQIIEHYKKQLT